MTSERAAHPKDRHPAARKPLEGIRVVDCSRVLSGPICGRMLADMGADVVKIESPEPDILRQVPPIVDGHATMYAQYNVGKRNVSIDLKSEGGPALLADLAARADVFLENFRPGVMARLGLDANRLRQANPRLVVCSISGWGQDGPWAARPAYAPMVQAEAGTLAMGGALRGGRMRGESMQHADLYAGMMASQAILSALFHRERTGEGQHLDVSMAEALVYVNEHASAEIAGHPGALGFPTWHFETFTLANGRAVHLMGLPEQVLPALAQALPIPGALDDPRFADAASRATHREAIVELLAESLARIPDRPTLDAALAGTPIVAVDVRSTRELAGTDWAQHRGLLTQAGPSLRLPTAPFRSRDLTIAAANTHVAHRGEHNREVLGEWLGLGPAACAALEAAGVLEAAREGPRPLDESPRQAFRERGDAPAHPTRETPGDEPVG
ncbi:MAG: CoA transferase [Myxococcales bacterium]|nr:CoA transferase [Myxococcales bacterium]